MSIVIKAKITGAMRTKVQRKCDMGSKQNDKLLIVVLCFSYFVIMLYILYKNCLYLFVRFDVHVPVNSYYCVKTLPSLYWTTTQTMITLRKVAHAIYRNFSRTLKFHVLIFLLKTLIVGTR